MGYVAKQLAPGETIEFATTLHPIVFVRAGFAVATSLLLALLLSGPIKLMFLAVAIIVAVSSWIRYSTSEFAITDKRVIIKVGWLHRKTMETLLTKVEGAEVDQPLLGRMLDYGSIRVKGTGGSAETFSTIKAAMLFRERVQEGAARSHAAAAQSHLAAIGGGPARTTDIAGQLERLIALRDRGELTPEQFEAQKAAILGD